MRGEQLWGTEACVGRAHRLLAAGVGAPSFHEPRAP